MCLILFFSPQESTTFEQFNMIKKERNDRDLNEIKSDKSNELVKVKVESFNKDDTKTQQVQGKHF